MNRHRLLKQWAAYLANAAQQAQLTTDPCPIASIQPIAGPRAGALEILAGLHAGNLLRALRRDDSATLRQFIPWEFQGDPQVYMRGRYLRVEAGWSDVLAHDMIRLEDLNPKPDGGGRWVAGQAETGQTVIASLNDRTAHFLVSGTTGSGKSVALRAAVLQLSRDRRNRLVLVDGKLGESLGCLDHLPSVVGPCAIEPMDIRGALGWVATQMRRRYENGHNGRLILIFDEIQEMVRDSVTVDLLRKLVSQGRAAGVHCLLATQHPTVDAFGDSATRRMLEGRLALRVGDPDASRVAVGGSTPRADRLLGAGDAYTIAPGACHRTQLAYVDGRDISKAGCGQWEIGKWPELLPEDIGRDLPGDDVEEVGWHYEGGELGVSLISAANSEGRPTLKDRLEDAGFERPGSVRAQRLLRLGREAREYLVSHGYDVLPSRKEGGR